MRMSGDTNAIDSSLNNPFIDCLPPELRNRIYFLCLVSSHCFNIEFGSIYRARFNGGDQTALKLCLSERIYWSHLYQLLNPEWPADTPDQRVRLVNLTQVSSLFRDEAIRYFYGNNLFIVRIGDDMSDDCAGDKSVRHYRDWLKKRPAAAVPVLRLLLVPQWSCYHQPQKKIAPWIRQNDMGTLLLDIANGRLVPIQVSETTTSCDTCWHEMCSKALEYSTKMEIDTAISPASAAKLVDDIWRHIRPVEPWSRMLYRVIFRRLRWHFGWIIVFPIQLIIGAVFLAHDIWHHPHIRPWTSAFDRWYVGSFVPFYFRYIGPILWVPYALLSRAIGFVKRRFQQLARWRFW